MSERRGAFRACVPCVCVWMWVKVMVNAHSLTHSLTHTFTHPLTSPSLQEDEDSDDAEAKETAAAMKVSHAFI